MADQKIITRLKKKDQKLLKDFGDVVKGLRKQNDWTLEDTEANGYPSWQHWQAIENGLKNLSFTTIINICRTLDIQPSELFADLEIK